MRRVYHVPGVGFRGTRTNGRLLHHRTGRGGHTPRTPVNIGGRRAGTKGNGRHRHPNGGHNTTQLGHTRVVGRPLHVIRHGHAPPAGATPR